MATRIRSFAPRIFFAEEAVASPAATAVLFKKLRRSGLCKVSCTFCAPDFDHRFNENLLASPEGQLQTMRQLLVAPDFKHQIVVRDERNRLRAVNSRRYAWRSRERVNIT